MGMELALTPETEMVLPWARLDIGALGGLAIKIDSLARSIRPEAYGRGHGGLSDTIGIGIGRGLGPQA